MAEILDRITVGGLIVASVDTDPSVGGLDLPAGSIAMAADGSGTFTKGVGASTNWAINSSEPAVVISGDAELNFGAEGDGNARVTIANSFVTNANFKTFSFIEKASSDHDLDDFLAENITFAIQNIQDNTSFDIVARVPSETWGIYTITYKIKI